VDNNSNGTEGKGLRLLIRTRWPALFRPSELNMAPYRRLALQLHRDLPRSGAPRSVMLVTPTPTSVGARGSANLARCMAEQLAQPVLLGDAGNGDQDGVSKFLGCSETRGFSNLLSEPNGQLQGLVLGTDQKNLAFLPAGALATNSRQASSEAIEGLLQTAQSNYDFTVLCGGAVLDDPLTLSIAPHVGRVMLVVIENETSRKDLEAAQEMLALCDVKDAAILLTTSRSDRWL